MVHQDNHGDVFLLVRGSGVELSKLVDKQFLYRVLEGLPNAIGMQPIQPPLVLEAHNNPGLEGYVPIDASNITISTYTQQPRFVAAIHSCREFPADAMLAHLQEIFGATEITYRYILESEFESP